MAATWSRKAYNFYKICWGRGIIVHNYWHISVHWVSIASMRHVYNVYTVGKKWSFHIFHIATIALVNAYRSSIVQIFCTQWLSTICSKLFVLFSMVWIQPCCRCSSTLKVLARGLSVSDRERTYFWWQILGRTFLTVRSNSQQTCNGVCSINT